MVCASADSLRVKLSDFVVSPLYSKYVQGAVFVGVLAAVDAGANSPALSNYRHVCSVNQLLRSIQDAACIEESISTLTAVIRIGLHRIFIVLAHCKLQCKTILFLSNWQDIQVTGLALGQSPSKTKPLCSRSFHCSRHFTLSQPLSVASLPVLADGQSSGL